MSDAPISEALDHFRSNICLPSKGKQMYLDEHIRSLRANIVIGVDEEGRSLKSSNSVEIVWIKVHEIKEPHRCVSCSSELSIIGVQWEEGVHCMSSELDDVMSAITEVITDGVDVSRLDSVLCTYRAGHCWILHDMAHGGWYTLDASRSLIFGSWTQVVEKLSSSGR